MRGKKKTAPLRAWEGPSGSRRCRLQELLLSGRHMNMVKLSALRIDLLYCPGYTPVTHSFLRLSRPQLHSEAGRTESMKIPNYPIRNQTHDLPACSAVSQQTAQPRKHGDRDIIFLHNDQNRSLYSTLPSEVRGSFLGVNEAEACRTYPYNPKAEVKKGGVMFHTLSALHLLAQCISKHNDNITFNLYTGLFISPSGISELDCATTKTDTTERSISIGRESLQVFFVLGALAYF